jgi:hypothetical protein
MFLQFRWLINMHTLLRRILRLKSNLIAFMFAAAMMEGCGGDSTGNSSTLSVPTPVASLAIVSTTPDNGATGADNGTVSVDFTAPMDCITLNNGGFVLKDASNTSIAGKMICSSNRATFTPATDLLADEIYTASVSTVAKDIAGNPLATGRIWSFTAERAWRTATLIETDNTGYLLSISPKVATDSFGNALAVWNQQIPNTPIIFSIRFSLGSGWDISMPIGNLDYSSNPEIAIDTNGNAIALWEELGSNIWSNYYTVNHGWGTPEYIGTADAIGGLSPRIAFDKSGNAIAVWQQGDGARTNVWSNRYTPSGGWGVPELLENDDSGDALAPQLAVDSSGNAFAVWSQSDATGLFNIWSNRYTMGVGWGVPELLETNNGNAAEPLVAFDGKGNALAVWSQWGTSGSDIWANSYTAGQGWGTAFLIETDDTGAAYTPQVAFDDNGNGLVVWTQWTTITRTGPCLALASVGGGGCIPTTVKISNIWSRLYKAGEGWGSPELVEINDEGNASYPRFAFDGNGNALAVWTQSNGVLTSVWANRYRSDTGWGTASIIQSNNTGDAMEPDIAVNSDGSAIAVWGQLDGTRANVWANRFY